MQLQRWAWSGGALALLLASCGRASAVSTDGYGAVFPGDNPWNIDISHSPLHPNSPNFVATNSPSSSLHPDFGTVLNGAPWGIPYDVVPGTQPKVTMTFVNYPNESEPGPYPVPADCPIEGGSAAPPTSDRHACVIDQDHHLLYELYNAFLQTDGSWHASNGAIFNLASNALRPAGWTSADAAGLPVFAGLARYDEVAAGAIHHALRCTLQYSQAAYLYPARHDAPSLPVPNPTPGNLAPMGLRFRLHANADLSHLSPQAHIIAVALQHYGMIMADNGSNWFLSGAPDPRWDDADINTLKTLHGSDFDAIDSSSMDPSLNATPPATPSGLVASPGSTNQVQLSWQANTDSDLLGYRVFQATASSGPWSEVSTGPVTTPAFTQVGLSGGTTYFYRITAEDQATNQSPPSAVATVAPNGAATTSASGGSSGSSGSSGASTSASASASATGAASGTTAAAASGGGGGGGGAGGCGLGASMGVIALVALSVRRVTMRSRLPRPRSSDVQPTGPR